MSPPYSGRLIQPGDSGDDVSTWQQQMHDRGWRINVTGVHDQQSVAVATAFQHEKGLGVDGSVGPDTWDGAFNLPVTPGPGAASAAAGSGQATAATQVGLSLYVNRRGDEIEIGATLTNSGRHPIAAEALTILLIVVNPHASESSHEREVARYEVPFVDPIAAGAQAYQLFYDTIPENRAGLEVHGWVFDTTTTYATDQISFQ